MPKQYSPEVKGRTVTYILERLDRYKSVYGACQDLAPKLNLGAETLRRWVVQAQAADEHAAHVLDQFPDGIQPGHHGWP